MAGYSVHPKMTFSMPSRAGRRGVAPAVAAIVAVTCVFAAAEAGPTAAGADHAPLTVDTKLALTDVVDVALAAFPAALEQAARSDEAVAWRARSRSLFSAQPALSLRYQTDRFGDDFGLQEIESGIQVALWKWGQRRAARGLGNALKDEASASELALRWEVSGLLRLLLWEIAEAERSVVRAAESADVAARLEAAVARRHALGDVAERDLLLARGEALDSASALTTARARLVDAERAYRSVTGMDRRPEIATEARSPLDSITEAHPALQLARAALARSESARTLARRTGTAAPTLMIGPRRERSTFAQPFEDSIGVFLTIPFGGRSHVDTAVAAAGRQVAAARAELRRVERALDLALHEAEHSLAVARENRQRADDRAALARRGYAMGETAYAAGEIGLVELLALRSARIVAADRADMLAIEVNRQIALYNHAVGELP